MAGPGTLRVCLALTVLMVLCACTHNNVLASSDQATTGDAILGERFLYAYNCGGCHVIPGIAEARGTVGPPLTGVGTRIYIAGLLPNTPDNLVRWITEPQQVQPGSAMPKMGVTRQEAVDIAAYLYTLH